MLLESIRQELVTLNQALPENGLVTWTSGNVSIRDPETGYVVITVRLALQLGPPEEIPSG